MFGYLTRRFIHSVFIIIGISLAVFAISRLTGDPVSLMVDFDTPREDREVLRKELGLDKPLPLQYLIFLKGAVKGEFGTSIRYEEPALKLVIERIPATLRLIAFTLGWSLLIAIPVGIISALKRNSFFDLFGMAITFLGQSIPSFWLGIMLIMIVGVKFHLLPISGYGDGDLLHVVMPALTLGAFEMASFARITRSSMLEVLDMDYIQTARAKGLRETAVVIKHAFRNSLIPIVTIMGIHVALLMGGAVITEQIFAYPGVGWLAIQSIYNRDFPVIQAIVTVVSVGVVATNFLIDILYTLIDPRIRYD
ncbi:MAG: ABC transporter permease [Deltaproteobacteria bacterium]|nr:ABC transporter permease [Deltaproteobacteria bacterium]MBW2015797.1 ABC transporter permease [Deltaproteobacteria bacterium]MBW2129219.1 ABC transporter permease [Deltaproteobacteria bacterium]MBW2303359.1 ABC transporter permease [Deltaproteobacteria bacterium]